MPLQPSHETILICTVGGSHEPVLAAIASLEPDFTCFVCTDRNPATRHSGSRILIEGDGSVEGPRMLNLLRDRNDSILAHGYQPVTEDLLGEWGQWIEDDLLPFLQLRGEAAGVKKLPPQLPDRYPDALLVTNRNRS